MEVSKILGSVEIVHSLAVSYFETIWTRMPIICRSHFFGQLPTMFSAPRADFLLLCLCVHLQLQYPTVEVSTGNISCALILPFLPLISKSPKILTRAPDREYAILPLR